MRGPGWAKLSDEKLLRLRLRDLPLRLRGAPIRRNLHRVRDELRARGITFSPHIWLSTEWFVADGVPGIAVPFYLAHPRLIALEAGQMGEAEGAADDAMMILRHECGHALAHAFSLRRRADVRKVFGKFSTPYPTHYRARPHSREFVRHLGRHYAQSHPDEDLAETFAVWLTPGSDWRRRYRDWPALKKLEFLDRLIKAEVQGRHPLIVNRSVVDPIGSTRQTLRQYYARKRRRFGLEGERLPRGSYAL